jgi:predicted PurR-regulated permease PerM
MNTRSIFTAKLDLVLTWLLTSGIRLVFLLVVAYLLLRAIRLLTDKFNRMLQDFTDSVERQKRAQTLSHIARAIATTVLFALTASAASRCAIASNHYAKIWGRSRQPKRFDLAYGSVASGDQGASMACVLQKLLAHV